MENLIQRIRLHYHYGQYQSLGKEWNSKNYLPIHLYIPEARIYLPESGLGIIEYKGNKYTLKRGNMLLIPPFTNARFHCPNRLVKYWCHFNAYIDDTQHDLFSFLPNITEIHLEPDELDYFYIIFDKMLKTARNKQDPEIYLDSVDIGEIRSLLFLLISPFLHNQPLNFSQREEANRIMTIVHYMYKNIDKPLTLKDLSGFCKLHPSYMSELFHHCMGTSPIAFFHRLKIECAIYELRRNKLRIKEIADLTGFSSAAIFSRFFSDFTGFSPREFRSLSRQEKIESL